MTIYCVRLYLDVPRKTQMLTVWSKASGVSEWKLADGA